MQTKAYAIRLEASWAFSEEFEQVIKRDWSCVVLDFSSSLLDRRRNCAALLIVWSNKVDQHSACKWIKLLETELARLCRGPITTANKFEEKRVEREIEQLLVREEIFWKQQGKTHWLREGKQNMSFFHNHASIRRKNNLINRIQNAEGCWLKKNEDIQNHIKAYFGDIFRSRNPSKVDVEEGT
ncbi:UNVERIFIED_CONTAM: hypothetical protein Sradi_3205200 [Sesamum radiatum]|uniref:Uncharacterized protein n=1 Tax=Sesamum radiatum TaxID=300843 RepID=A0AAW2RFK7_SESRA